jgi:endonuclease YncB( thermonuclease family)
MTAADKDRWFLFGLATFAGSVLALLPCAADAQKAAPSTCGTGTSSTAEVITVRDGRSLILADGRELLLAGIEAAPEGTAALRRLTAGRTLHLVAVNSSPDRYGRTTAFATADGAGQSLQQALLMEGQARVSARVGGADCTHLLLEAERMARAAGRGLWSDPNFAPLSSEDLTKLAAGRGQFALVEGKVLSVRESGATIYVNFGRRWTRDFTVTILKSQRRTFVAAGLEPEKLASRRIRVRGWVEQRGGPIIEAAVPEQIEIID